MAQRPESKSPHQQEPDLNSERHRRLAALLPLWPSEIDDTSPSGRARLIAMLERALRGERRRGLAGHWTYDLARHAQLLAAYRDEVDARRCEVERKTKRPRIDHAGPAAIERSSGSR